MVLDTAIDLRASGHEVFVDWFGGGPKADEHWRDTQIALGHNMREAIEGSYAQNILAYDERWMEWAECVVVVEPAGKSGHMELVHFLKDGKPGYLYFPLGDPDRWDVMFGWATKIVYTMEELLDTLQRNIRKPESGPDAIMQNPADFLSRASLERFWEAID